MGDEEERQRKKRRQGVAFRKEELTVSRERPVARQASDARVFYPW